MATHPTVLKSRLQSVSRIPLGRTCLVVLSAAVLAIGLVPATGQAAPKLTLSQVQARLDALNADAENAQEAANAAVVASAATQRKLDQATVSMRAAQASMADAQRLVGELAAAAYRNGGIDQTLQLLVADDPAQFVAQASAMEGVDRHQADVLRAAAAGQQRLTQAKLAVSQQADQLNALKAQTLAHLADVQARAKEMKALLSSLQESERKALEAKQAADRAAAKRANDARSTVVHRPTRSSGSHSSNGSNGSNGNISPASGIGAKAAAYALAQVGDAYVWGATGPSAFDCSGLTMRAYGYAGVSLPHSSSAQFGSGSRISASNLQPGDLVFYYSPIHHVGIYIGGGMIVHAANPSAGVRVASLYSMPFSGAVRPY